jgi:hypothetical protein
MANEVHPSSDVPKRPWLRPSLKFIGHVRDIVQFPGGGKLSVPAEDMGDAQRKPKARG